MTWLTALRRPTSRSEMVNGWDIAGFFKVDVEERHRDRGAVSDEEKELETEDHGESRK